MVGRNATLAVMQCPFRCGHDHLKSFASKGARPTCLTQCRQQEKAAPNKSRGTGKTRRERDIYIYIYREREREGERYLSKMADTCDCHSRFSLVSHTFIGSRYKHCLALEITCDADCDILVHLDNHPTKTSGNHGERIYSVQSKHGAQGCRLRSSGVWTCCSHLDPSGQKSRKKKKVPGACRPGVPKVQKC